MLVEVPAVVGGEDTIVLSHSFSRSIAAMSLPTLSSTSLTHA
jgi:hypothetical protein